VHKPHHRDKVADHGGACCPHMPLNVSQCACWSVTLRRIALGLFVRVVCWLHCDSSLCVSLLLIVSLSTDVDRERVAVFWGFFWLLSLSELRLLNVISNKIGQENMLLQLLSPIPTKVILHYVQIKQSHFYFYDNFGNWCLISAVFSLLHLAINCGRGRSERCHLTT